jgi:hypothetical protein
MKLIAYHDPKPFKHITKGVLNVIIELLVLVYVARGVRQYLTEVERSTAFRRSKEERMYVMRGRFSLAYVIVMSSRYMICAQKLMTYGDSIPIPP